MATVDEAQKVLDSLWNDLSLPVERDDDPDRCFFGNITYTLPGGWKIVVFVDAGDWDYIDHIVAPDGTKLDPDTVPKDDPDGIWHSIFHWSPRIEDERWGKYRSGLTSRT